MIRRCIRSYLALRRKGTVTIGQNSALQATIETSIDLIIVIYTFLSREGNDLIIPAYRNYQGNGQYSPDDPHRHLKSWGHNYYVNS